MAVSPFAKLFESLAQTRKSMAEVLGKLIPGNESTEMIEELEVLLLSLDMGVETTEEILDWLGERRRGGDLKELLGRRLESMLADGNGNQDLDDASPTAVLVVGVNGTGKTTSAAKLAHRLRKRGEKVLLIAADTYRAAALDQLKVWQERAGVDLICNEATKDPSSVLFDGLKAARSRKCRYAIVDSAGRLHTSRNLMGEAEKMYRVATTRFPDFSVVNYITLDANLGQNSLVQASAFNEHLPLSGIILTKMDGTAKGGIIFRINQELNIPVRFLGVGETLDDLIEFIPSDYVASLLGNRD